MNRRDLLRSVIGAAALGAVPSAPVAFIAALGAGIGDDALDEREAAARAAIEDKPRAISVLRVGRMDDDVPRRAEHVDDAVPLAAPTLS